MKSAEDNVPLELKLQHAREEVEKLGPEVRRCMHVIAEQQVEVEQLERKVNRHQKELASQEHAILKLRNDLKSDNATYVYAGHAYSEGEVRSDLKLRFTRFKAAQETLNRDRQILAARRKTLVANERRLDEMIAAKKQLEVQIEQLEARNKALEAAKVTSELEFDDSHLARTRTLLRKIDKEMNVDETLLRQEGKMNAGSIPVNAKPVEIETEDITNEIDTYFKGNGTNPQITPAGESWVVMEYCDGESLEEAIAAHPHGLPIDEALQWFRGICAGVGFLHEHGIVHRDLKPSHIFREHGVVKICDYGLAKFISVSRRSGNTDGVGTVYYAAPEIAKGRYGKELDLYSLGVMFYESLSGDVPFDGESAAEILMKHLTEKPDVSRFPAPYRQIVARLLEKEPTRRFRTVEELMQTFDAPITATPAKGSSCNRFPIAKRVCDKIQPKKRVGQLLQIIKRNKFATAAVLAVSAAAMGLGIAIGEATRYPYHPQQIYHHQSSVSSSRLSMLRVKRNDQSGSTVRLSEIASFDRVQPRTNTGRRLLRSTAYAVEVNQRLSERAGVGNQEILEAIWDGGMSPNLEIVVDDNLMRKNDSQREHVYMALLRHRNLNNLRRQQMQIHRTQRGFLVEFRHNRSSRASRGIVDFYLLDPHAIFELSIEPEGSSSQKRVPIKDIAEVRIIAGRS
eukprot:g26503.t1